jgi:hypothetical protein
VSDRKMSGSESPLTQPLRGSRWLRKGFQSLSKRVEVADAPPCVSKVVHSV